jgi:hypothetical protein
MFCILVYYTTFCNALYTVIIHYTTLHTESEFVNVYRAQESFPPGWESILGNRSLGFLKGSFSSFKFNIYFILHIILFHLHIHSFLFMFYLYQIVSFLFSHPINTFESLSFRQDFHAYLNSIA